MSAAISGTRIVLCVSGGIAAYKAIDVCRRLVDAGAHVSPVLTEDALSRRFFINTRSTRTSRSFIGLTRRRNHG